MSPTSAKPEHPRPRSPALIREAAEAMLEIEERWRAIGESASRQEKYALACEHLARAFEALPASVKSEMERIRASSRGYGRNSRYEKRRPKPAPSEGPLWLVGVLTQCPFTAR